MTREAVSELTVSLSTSVSPSHAFVRLQKKPAAAMPAAAMPAAVDACSSSPLPLECTTSVGLNLWVTTPHQTFFQKDLHYDS